MRVDSREREYRLQADEELAEGLKRVAFGRVEQALERLRGSAGELDSADAVHGARKDLKKLRTVLRLLRGELPKGVYEEEMRCYREAARMLSPARDAEVKLEALDALVGQASGLPEEAVAAWRQILDRDREAAANATGDAQAAIEMLEAGLARIEGWRLEEDSWKLIGGAVKRSYRRGRQAMRAAERDPREESFHRWRKRAKDLWYELRLLEAVWPEALRSLADETHRLSDLLGNHHDLAVLREDLHERRLGEEETRALEAAIDSRQEQLAAEALDLGQRIYAERPKDFTRRLRRYWQAWRSGSPG